jgi:hypothetical protein
VTYTAVLLVMDPDGAYATATCSITVKAAGH